MNRSVLRALLWLACPLALLAAGCGSNHSKKPSPAVLLAQTSKATGAALKSARLTGRLQLDPEGLLALGGPVVLQVAGPLARSAGGGLPRAQLKLVATVARQRYRAGLLADGKRAFIVLHGVAYTLGEHLVGTRANRSAEPRGVIGVDPARWIKQPSERPGATLDGVDTTHVGGAVDAAKLLGDLGDVVPAAERAQIAGAIKSATADVWSGRTDHILRRLVVRLRFAFARGSKPPIEGLEGGKLTLQLLLEDVNRAVPRVRAPRHARPLSRLASGRGLSGFLKCLTATGSAAPAPDLARCAAALGP